METHLCEGVVIDQEVSGATILFSIVCGYVLLRSLCEVAAVKNTCMTAFMLPWLQVPFRVTVTVDKCTPSLRNGTRYVCQHGRFMVVVA